MPHETIITDLKRTTDIAGWDARVRNGAKRDDAMKLEVEELRHAMSAMERERDRLAARLLSYKALEGFTEGVIANLAGAHSNEVSLPGRSRSRLGVRDAHYAADKAYPSTSNFQPGFLELRRIITQATSISTKAAETKSLISNEHGTTQSAMNALDQIDDFANTIVAMATILQPVSN